MINEKGGSSTAISKELRIDENTPVNSKVLICTDSYLENPMREPRKFDMKSSLEKLPADIHIASVPENVNIPGHEYTDQVAKISHPARC